MRVQVPPPARQPHTSAAGLRARREALYQWSFFCCSSASLAKFAASRRASSLVSSLAAKRWPALVRD